MRHLTAVPDLEVEDPYGWVPFLANSNKPPIKPRECEDGEFERVKEALQ